MSHATEERERNGWETFVGKGVDARGGQHWRSATFGVRWALPLIAAVAVIGWDSGARADDFQVNSYTYYSQISPDICNDPNGNFVVVWEARWEDGDGYGIFARHFDNTFSPVGPDFQVNTATLGDQGSYYSGPAVACNNSGGFVVVWPSSYPDYAVWGQRFDNLDIAVGTAFMVNTFTYQNYPGYNNVDVAMDGAGDFVVVWDSFGQDGDGYGVFGQRFASNATRVGTEFQVNTYTYYNQGGRVRDSDIKVAMGTDGKFVVVWGSAYQDGDGEGVFARQFNSAGVGASEFQVNTYTYSYQGASIGVAKNASGNFVVAWSSYDQDGYGNGVFAQRFTSLGSRSGTEFQVNTYTAYDQGGYRDITDGVGVAYEPGGDFMVAWASNYQDGDSWGIFGQRYASSGSPSGTEFQVNTYTQYYQFHPNVASRGPGEFVVVWQGYGQDYDGFGIFGNLPTTPAPPTATPTPSPATCGAAPIGGCATPGKGKLLIKDKDPAGMGGNDKVIYQWLKGPMLNQSDFGNPASGGTDILVCVYANNALVSKFKAPAGAPWEALSTKGYSYKDGAGTNGGLQKIQLKGGADGKSKISVKAKGGNIQMPGLPLNDSTNVTVQVVRGDNSACWQTVFPGPGNKNDTGGFSDKFP